MILFLSESGETPGSYSKEMAMKAMYAGMLMFGLVVGVLAGCNKDQSKEGMAMTPEPSQAPAYPEEQVQKPEPQPIASPPPPSEPVSPTPVDSSAKAQGHKKNTAAAAEKPAPKEKYAPKETKQSRTYVVKKGDTLQKISEKYYGTTKRWNKIYQANKKTIKDFDKLTEGTKLVIP